MLPEYRGQLLNAGIPFHVEHIADFPHPSGLPVSFKFHWMREFATRFQGFDRITFSDGYDVWFIGTSDVDENIPSEVTWGAERNCFPEPQLAEQIGGGDTPWRYVNAGMMSGSPEAILDWVTRAERHPAYEGQMLDQKWLNRRLADSPELIRLDNRTTNFYVVSSTQESGELQMKNSMPWNSLCDSYPQFFHFSGGCKTDSFRRLLAGTDVELR